VRESIVARVRSAGGAAVVVSTLTATGIALLLDTVKPRVALAGLTAFLLALLAIRGNLAAATVGAAGLLAQIVAWGVRTHVPPTEIGVHLVVNGSVAGLGFLCRYLLIRIVRRERAHRKAAARSTLAAQVAEDSAHLAADELAVVRSEVSPLLAALRDGVPLDSAALAELAVTEAAIRDRIRVPRLQTAGLPQAIRRAREHSVSVHLMGHADDERLRRHHAHRVRRRRRGHRSAVEDCRAMGATSASAALTRSAGANPMLSPRRPPETYTVLSPSADSSTTHGCRLRWPSGEMPPTTYPVTR
jgi:hypothetical protein